MELGADAVLVNTAIARADDPAAMARAFRLGGRGRPRRAARRADRGARDGRGRRARSAGLVTRRERHVNGRAQELEPGETVESLLDAARPGRRRTRSSSGTASRSSASRYGETALEDGDTLVVARPGRRWIAAST